MSACRSAAKLSRARSNLALSSARPLSVPSFNSLSRSALGVWLIAIITAQNEALTISAPPKWSLMTSRFLVSGLLQNLLGFNKKVTRRKRLPRRVTQRGSPAICLSIAVLEVFLVLIN